jgi:hypothetical protein
LAVEAAKKRRVGTIKVYSERQPISSDGAIIDFALTLTNAGPPRTKKTGHRPEITGPCIKVEGRRDQTPTVTLDHVDLKSSCIEVDRAKLVITNSSVTPPNGTSGVSVRTGEVEANGLRLSGGANARAISLMGSAATLSNISISGFTLGLYAQESDLTLNGGTIEVESGIWVETPRESDNYQIRLSSLTLTGPRNGADSFGIRVDAGVRGSIVIRGAAISGFGTGISASSPLSVVEQSHIVGNGTGVRFGRSEINRGGAAGYVMQDATLSNTKVDLETHTPVSLKVPKIPQCAWSGLGKAERGELEKWCRSTREL